MIKKIFNSRFIGTILKQRSMATLSWIGMRDHLCNISDFQKELRDTIEKFGKAEIAPIAEKIDKEMSFPRELWNRMGHLGILGITVAEKYGGMGLGYFDHCLVMEELSRYSASVGLSYGAHSNLCVNQIHRNGTDEQKMKYLPKLLTGEWIGALAMSETEAGSDVVSMRCKAEYKNGKYYLSGSKMWITNGPDCDVCVVYAKTQPDMGPKGITAFIVEKNMKGFSSGPKLDKVGMRGSKTSQLFFEDVEVPAENILGEPNKGVKVLMSGLDFERLVLSAGPVGIMQAAMDVVLPYVRIRKQFGQPIGRFELMQGRAYLYAVAGAADKGYDCAGTILNLAEAGTHVTWNAIQALGGNGYINEYPTGRLWRDAKLYEIGAGTSEIRRMLIGRELFDSPDV